jgi:hypothetical protein
MTRLLSDLREVFRRYPLMGGALALSALAALGLLGVGLIDLFFWEPGLNEPVAGWMTVGYIAEAWDLDPREIDLRAGLPLPVDGRPFTLAEAAEMQGVPLADVIARLQATVDALLAER